MERLSTPARFYRYLAIGICSFPLATSFAITKGYHLDTPACLIRHWLGVICPGCGMTRSLISLSRGEIGQAFDYHLFGPILFVGLTIAMICCLWELRCGYYIPSRYRRWLTNLPIQISLIVSFCGYYLLRLNHILPTAHL